MRQFALMFVLATLLPAMSHAAESKLSWGLGGDWRVSVNTKLDLETVGAFDFSNDQWMTGIGKDILDLHKGEYKVAYLSGEQMFNLGEQGKGAFLLALGVMTGTLARLGEDAVQYVVPEAKLPKWLEATGNYVSIEGGYGRRLFGVPQGQTPHVWTLGGQVRIPLDKLRGLLWKTKKVEDAPEPSE